MQSLLVSMLKEEITRLCFFPKILSFSIVLLVDLVMSDLGHINQPVLSVQVKYFSFNKHSVVPMSCSHFLVKDEFVMW